MDDLKKDKLISVVIPVYNVEKYLRQCLDSVISSSYRNLEILIVDDGSSDKSGIICDEYARRDKRITVYHTVNRGLSAARNYALGRLTGEYIAFLDSDDWLEVDTYKTLLNVALTTGADIVNYRFYKEYVNKTMISSGSEKRFVVEGDEILRFLLLKKITDDVWDKFYKASLFKSIRYPKGRIFEDKATTYQLIKKSEKLVYLPDCLIHYRNRNNSLSNNHSMKSLIDYWLAYRERFEILSLLSPEYFQISLAECISAISRMWRWYAGCSKEEKDLAEKWLDEMQQFAKKYYSNIMNDSFYSKHIKVTCIYVRYRSPICFSVLYLLTQIYRNVNRGNYFPE